MRSAQRSSLAMDDPPDPAEAERRLARGFANDDDERHGDRDDDPHRALGKSQPLDDGHADAAGDDDGTGEDQSGARAGPRWRWHQPRSPSSGDVTAPAMSRRRTPSAATSAKPSMGQRLPSPPAPA